MESFADVLPPSRIGRYEILERLGAGGMAEVLVAMRQGLGGFAKPVAIKRILPEFAKSQQFRAMMHREAALAAMLDHPNCVEVLELEDIEGQMLIAMELLHGCDASTLQGTSKVETGIALRVIADAARGLHHAHTLADGEGKPLGVVHRDISPQNLFVTVDGITKVLDFGIASASEVLDGDTRTGALKGKYCYMAPEQVDLRPLDGRTDVWALGVTLWGMLTGQALFDGSALEVLEEIRHKPLPTVLERGAEVSGLVNAVVMRALAKDPAERFPSALAFAEALEGLDPCPHAKVAAAVDRVAGKRIRALKKTVRKARKANERLRMDAPSSRPPPRATAAGVKAPRRSSAPEAFEPTKPGRVVTPRSAFAEARTDPGFVDDTEPTMSTVDDTDPGLDRTDPGTNHTTRDVAPSSPPPALALGADESSHPFDDMEWFVLGFVVMGLLLLLAWPLP